MKGRLDTAVNGCLLIATLLLVWRLSAGAKSKGSSGAAFETVSDSIWRESVSGEPLRIGPPVADTAVIFTDVQCPFCKSFEATLNEVEKAVPHGIAKILLHFPLPQHPHSRAGATAVECARRFGKADYAYGYLLEKQDSLETMITPRLSRSFGIKDSIGFSGCMHDGVATILARHASIAERLQIQGTPAVMLNGRLWRYPPSKEQLTTALRR